MLHSRCKGKRMWAILEDHKILVIFRTQLIILYIVKIYHDLSTTNVMIHRDQFEDLLHLPRPPQYSICRPLVAHRETPVTTWILCDKHDPGIEANAKTCKEKHLEKNHGSVMYSYFDRLGPRWCTYMPVACPMDDMIDMTSCLHVFDHWPHETILLAPNPIAFLWPARNHIIICD